jgi:type II secretory pathway pseudopilin PulG
MSPRAVSRPAFTITELLIVIAVIVVLIGLLTAALAGVMRSAEMTKSMNNLRQIALWMRQYSSDNTEHILPSQFNYSSDPYPGKVRSGNVALGPEHMGTWSDILWAVFEVGAFEDQASPGAPNYRFDSPDQALYDKLGRWDENPFRSAAANARSVEAGTGPRPFGTGAQEAGEAGYFAANQFFNADPTTPDPGWYTLGQIKLPSQSMYLIDSFAGEVIEDDLDLGGPFDNTTGSTSLEVDFRYGDACLMLFLDGHIDQQGPWQDPGDLRARNIRIRDLTSR